MALRKTQSHARPQPPKKAPGKGGPGFAYRQEGTNELSAPLRGEGIISEKASECNGKIRPIPMLFSIYRKLFTQFTSESCHTLSATSRRIRSVTGPFFASFSSMALCNSATVIAS